MAQRGRGAKKKFHTGGTRGREDREIRIGFDSTLAKDVTQKLEETAEYLEVPQSRILEVLVRMHADALQIRVE